jgi:hypothetical protein
VSEQPRDPHGRFATAECPRVYALLDTLTPPPARAEGSSYVSLGPALRCPHGRFARYAVRNCCPGLEIPS